MALETGVNYVEDFVETNPTATDPRHEGDDHMRLIKVGLKGSVPFDLRDVISPTEGELLAINANSRIANRKYGITRLVAGYTKSFELEFTLTETLPIAWEAPGTSYLVNLMGASAVAVDPIGLYTSANNTRLTCSGVTTLLFAIHFELQWQTPGNPIENAIFDIILKKNGSEVDRCEVAGRFGTVASKFPPVYFFQDSISDNDYFEVDMEARQLDSTNIFEVSEIGLIVREIG